MKGKNYMGYTYGLAVFIDLLGTKEISLDKDFDELYRRIQCFHYGLKQIKKIMNGSFGDEIVSVFSDCAYIAYEINKEDENLKNLLMLIDLHTISKRLLDFLTFQKVPFRGGIAFGKLYINSTDNMLFGQAVIDAYTLETKGEMPRLILTDVLGKGLLEYSKKITNSDYSYLSKLIQIDDFDDSYYLNFLDNNTCSDYNFQSIYKISKENSLNTIANTNDDKIVAKHKWHLGFLERMNEYRQ
jgi:hypothetical protein